ncbi:MAG: cation:proton antiporter [Desulfococcaceae bacterium]
MILETATRFVLLPLLSLSVLMVFVRLILGPSLADRVVALDLLATIGISVVAGHALATRQAVFLDVAILLALIAFLSTVAFADYVERGVRLQRELDRIGSTAEAAPGEEPLAPETSEPGPA